MASKPSEANRLALPAFHGLGMTKMPGRWCKAHNFSISVVEMHESALSSLADWKEKYRDLPVDLADASLIWLAQQTGVLDILTIDRKNFSVYRMPNGKSLKLVL